MGIIILLGIILLSLIYFNPYIDRTKDKVILWYNWNGYRNYKILWSKEI